MWNANGFTLIFLLREFSIKNKRGKQTYAGINEFFSSRFLFKKSRQDVYKHGPPA